VGVNYYNDIDPYCCEWLRNLIDAGDVPPGVVDGHGVCFRMKWWSDIESSTPESTIRSELMSERERRLDKIREYSDKLIELGRRYDQLRWMAEKEDATDAFLCLAEAAGQMTVSSLCQLGNLLEILWTAREKS
jgi:hypothetical protein